MGGVIQVKAVLGSRISRLVLLHEVCLASAHGLACVFRICEHVRAVRAHSQAEGDHEYGGADEHVAPLLLFQVEDELDNPHHGYEHAVIEEHLWVLGGSRSHEQRGEDTSQDILLLAEYQIERSQDHGGVRDGPGLGYMARPYDYQEIRGQAHGYGPHYAQPFVHVETAQADEEAQEIHEDDPGGVVGLVKDCVNRAENILRGVMASSDLVVWHSAEHGSVPESPVSGQVMVYQGLVRCSRKILLVSGKEDLAFELG